MKKLTSHYKTWTIIFTTLLIFCSFLLQSPTIESESHVHDTVKGDSYFLPPGADKSLSFFEEARMDSNDYAKTVYSMIDSFKVVYPDIKFKVLWEIQAVNAVAKVRGGQKIVELWGGMIYHPYMRMEGWSIVLAHEIGHHYGGEPTYEASDMSCEGQADFWAVTECLPNTWSDYMTTQIIERGSIQLHQLFTNGLKKNLFKKDITKFDKKNNVSPDCGHPPADCRIRTYQQGLVSAPTKPACAGPSSNHEN